MLAEPDTISIAVQRAIEELTSVDYLLHFPHNEQSFAMKSFALVAI